MLLGAFSRQRRSGFLPPLSVSLLVNQVSHPSGHCLVKIFCFVLFRFSCFYKANVGSSFLYDGLCFFQVTIAFLSQSQRETNKQGRKAGSLLCSFGREHKTTMTISTRQRGETIRDGQIVPSVCIASLELFYFILLCCHLASFSFRCRWQLPCSTFPMEDSLFFYLLLNEARREGGTVQTLVGGRV